MSTFNIDVKSRLFTVYRWRAKFLPYPPPSTRLTVKSRYYQIGNGSDFLWDMFYSVFTKISQKPFLKVTLVFLQGQMVSVVVGKRYVDLFHNCHFHKMMDTFNTANTVGCYQK